MALNTINPTETVAWKQLQLHYNEMQNASMQEMFQTDNSRTKKFNLKWNDFLIDYSKNIVTEETLQLLKSLTEFNPDLDEIKSRLTEEVHDYFYMEYTKVHLLDKVHNEIC